MRANAARVCATRTRLCAGLRTLGFYVWDSQANFVLARLGERWANNTAAELYAELKERRILVRYFASPPRLADCLRISVGTDEEIAALLATLKELSPV